MRTIFIVLLGCLSTLATAADPDYRKKGSAGNIEIEGNKNRQVQILIRTVDDGDVLIDNRYQLGRKVWVGPGEHVLSVMCEFKFSWGKKLLPGSVTLQTMDGKSYQLILVEGSFEAERCDVEAAEG